MSDNSTVEERLSRLESAFEELSKRVNHTPPESRWWERNAGILAEFPEFDEVVELGQQIRSGKLSVPELDP